MKPKILKTQLQQYSPDLGSSNDHRHIDDYNSRVCDKLTDKNVDNYTDNDNSYGY